MALISVIKQGFDKEYDYFRVKKENSEKFEKLYNTLVKSTEKGKAPSTQALKNFLSLLENVSVKNDAIYNEKEKEVISNVLEYFKKHRIYQFHIDKGMFRRLPDVSNFEDLVRYVVMYLVVKNYRQMKEHGKDDYDDRDNVIRVAYIIIDRYLKGVYEYSHKQKSVLAGYITMCFGYSLIDTRKPITNELIYQATRNPLKRLKKKPTTT